MVKKIQLIGGNGTPKTPGFYSSLPIGHDPEDGSYFVYKNGKPLSRDQLHTRRDIDNYKAQDKLTLLPHDSVMEVENGQKMFAVELAGDLLARLGLDSPPASYDGYDITWVNMPGVAYPHFVTFLPEDVFSRMRDDIASRLLGQIDIEARRAADERRDPPHETIHALADYAIGASRDRELRYAAYLAYLASGQAMGKNYTQVRDRFVRPEFPEKNLDDIDQEVSALRERGYVAGEAASMSWGQRASQSRLPVSKTLNFPSGDR